MVYRQYRIKYNILEIVHLTTKNYLSQPEILLWQKNSKGGDPVVVYTRGYRLQSHWALTTISDLRPLS